MNDNLYRNINGQLQAGGAYRSADPAIRQRYGLYETMLYRQGQLERAALHWQRLLDGLPALDFVVPAPYSAAYFEGLIAELVQANKLEALARIRLQVFAGAEEDPGMPFFYIESFPLDDEVTRFDTTGLRVGILDAYRKPVNRYSNLKLSHSDHIAPSAAAVAACGWDDVLLCNEKGNICESAIANIFMIKDGQILTPPLQEGCLAGTMRAWLIPRLRVAGYEVRELPLSPELIFSADELFLTNSIRGIRHIRQLENRFFAPDWSAGSVNWSLICNK
jgi:branched-chain amino acid aminotransferase